MIGKNLNLKGKNIDYLIDMLVETQKENGVEPTMHEALYDPDTNERINRFKRKKLEAQGVDLSKYGLKTKEKKSKSEISNIERGVFVYSEDDLFDETEGEYICEYCTKISYDGSYRPDVCDTCNECEGCTEYIGDSCDGCAYSTLCNGGNSYGQMTKEEYGMNDEDAEIFNAIEDVPEYEKEVPSGKFSIMNY